jgi:uncharacterized protein (TIGR02147 family)
MPRIANPGGSPAPDILDYTNYRQFLSDFYNHRKSVQADFSLRLFAEQARFSSHGHLKYVIDGRRNLSKKTLIKLARALDLNGPQEDYFEKLVFFNQAETLEEKQHFYAKLLSYSKFKKLEGSQMRLFENWYHTVIREMVALKSFRGNPEWIGNHLIPKVESREVEASLKMLLDHQLLVRTANGYKQTEKAITTDDEVRSIVVKKFHSHMLGLASQALNQLPASRRDISSVTFPIKESDFPKLKKHLQLMRKELRKFASEHAGDGIVQVNFQLFPLTKGL